MKTKEVTITKIIKACKRYKRANNIQPNVCYVSPERISLFRGVNDVTYRRVYILVDHTLFGFETVADYIKGYEASNEELKLK